jgi:uncharacterized protein YkwD
MSERALPPPGRRPRAGAPAELAFCVEETNRYRALKKRPPLTRSDELDAYSAAGARMDHAARRPHHHFNTVEFKGTFRNFAENELPWWHLDPEGSVRDVIRAGLASMWAEGPGGGHYDNSVGPFTEMGCGLWIEGDAITVVQNFRSP